MVDREDLFASSAAIKQCVITGVLPIRSGLGSDGFGAYASFIVAYQSLREGGHLVNEYPNE